MKVKPTHLTISIIAASAHIASAIPTPNPQFPLPGAFYPTFLSPTESHSSSVSSSPSSATFAPAALNRRIPISQRRRDGTTTTTTAEDDDDDEDDDSSGDSEDDNSVEVSTATTASTTSTTNTSDSEGNMSSRVDDHKAEIEAEIRKGVCEGYKRCTALAKGGARCEEPSGGC